MIFALISGTLFRNPEQRVSKSGKPFTTATMRVKDGDAAQFVRVTAFFESAQTELLRLSDGDSLSVQGPFKAETYVANSGETKISLSIVTDKILPLKQQPKQRQEKAPASCPRQEPAPFDDGLPDWGAK